MAVVKPFRALRYDEAVAGPLETLVAPPYDVITPEQREELRARSPHNVVRLTLPDSEDEAGAGARGVARTGSPRRGAAGGLGARAGVRRPGRDRTPALRDRRVAQGRAVRDRHGAAARAHAPRPEGRAAAPAAGDARPARADLPALRRPGARRAARPRARPRGRGREAVADRRPVRRPRLRRQAAADRGRPPPLRDRGRLPRGGGHAGERADARRARLDERPRPRDLPHAPPLRRAQAPRERDERRRRGDRGDARRLPGRPRPRGDPRRPVRRHARATRGSRTPPTRRRPSGASATARRPSRTCCGRRGSRTSSPTRAAARCCRRRRRTSSRS